MLNFKRTTKTDSDFQKLVLELDKELWGIYDLEQEKFQDNNRLDMEVRVVVSYKASQVGGCGCFRNFDKKTAEVKRMYTKPHLRGLGIARGILLELEKWAREEHFTRMILETGFKQPEALSVYLKSGYTRIENFGPYKDSSYSICLEKVLPC
jgi:GNAT superfamily N-acetyltransferase